MTRWVKKGVAATLLFLWALSGGHAVDAQPLGLGGSQAAEKPEYQVLFSPNGRFVFGQISASSKDQFMLDTTTGRLWRMGESGKIGIFLKAVPYLDAEGECTLLPDRILKPDQVTPGDK